MAKTQALSVVQGNILKLTIRVKQTRGLMPFDLTGSTLALVVKATQTSEDGTGTTYDPEITNETQGLATLVIPGSDNGTPGTTWYRLDVITGSNHVTAAQGDYVVSAA